MLSRYFLPSIGQGPFPKFAGKSPEKGLHPVPQHYIFDGYGTDGILYFLDLMYNGKMVFLTKLCQYT